MLAITLRLITAVLLAIMFALVKLAATRGVHVVESLFYRQIGSALCAVALVAAGPGFASLRTKRIGAHVGRMALGVTAMGLLTASVTIVIRRLGATERASTTVFWFAVSSLVPLGLLMLHFGKAHDAQTWAILAAMALAGGLAQLTLTGALRLAPVALVMPMDYTSLLWATLLGMWLFAELPTPWVWVGAPVIIGSGLVIVWREHRLSRRAALSASAATPT